MFAKVKYLLAIGLLFLIPACATGQATGTSNADIDATVEARLAIIPTPTPQIVIQEVEVIGEDDKGNKIYKLVGGNTDQAPIKYATDDTLVVEKKIQVPVFRDHPQPIKIETEINKVSGNYTPELLLVRNIQKDIRNVEAEIKEIKVQISRCCRH